MSDESASDSRGGRPRALDEVKRREVCALISAGCGMEDAARYVGCAPITIRREAARIPEFGEELRRAYLAAELSPLNAMRQAAKTHWRAAAWLLERTNPQRFAKQNVRLLKPEQARDFVEFIVNIMKEETPNPEALDRISRRVNAAVDHMEQEILACHNRVQTKPAPRKPPNLFANWPSTLHEDMPTEMPHAQQST